jgi:tetratricopeptide (TPR) repeat protein
VSNFQMVSFERHAKQKWNWSPDYAFAARSAIAPLYAGELGSAVAAMPVAFVEASGRHTLAAVTSLFPDRNYFVGADGKWQGRYIPVFFRLFPFRLLPSTGGPVLCIDEDSGALASVDQPGLSFFSPDGTPAPALQEVMDQFRKLAQIEQQTDAAIAALAKAGVIQPWPLKLADGNGGVQDIAGLHRADEDVLNALGDAAFAALRRPLALAIAYGQLYSTNQMSLLAELGSSSNGPTKEQRPAAATPPVSSPPSATPSQTAATSRPSKATQRKVSSLFDQALRLSQANRLGKAESICRKILALDDGHAESWHMLGGIALQSGRMDDAAEMSAKAVALKPKFPAALFNLGIALAARGDPKAAIDAYQRALALRPDHAEALTNLGSALSDVGQTEEAMARYEQALALKPRLPGTLYNLGVALDALGRKNEAIDRYRQALALKPDYVEALSNLGGVLTSQGKPEEGAVYFERALSIKPDRPQVLNNLGHAQAAQGHLAAAIGNCLAALRHSGISVPESVDEASSIERIVSDIPADYPFTSDQQEYVSSIIIFSLHKHSVADWADIVAPLKRIRWSPTMRFGILVNQGISYWARGDLASLTEVLSTAGQDLAKISKATGTDFVNAVAYYNYTKALLESVSTASITSAREPLVMIVGDSHGLSYTRTVVDIGGEPHVAKAELVMGCKAWHLANSTGHGYKQRFDWAIARAPEQSTILCSFGEIDCRINEGILPFYKKRGGNLEDIVGKQTADYVDYVSKRLAVHRQVPIFLGVPAPFLASPRYEFDGATIEDQRLLVRVIRTFNHCLRDATVRRGFRFVDLYSLTDAGEGKADGTWHVDTHHLKPAALALALRNC